MVEKHSFQDSGVKIRISMLPWFQPRIVGNPVEDYVPTVYISAAINFLSVALVQGICSARPAAEGVAGEALSIGSVRGLVVMGSQGCGRNKR